MFVSGLQPAQGWSAVFAFPQEDGPALLKAQCVLAWGIVEDTEMVDAGNGKFEEDDSSHVAGFVTDGPKVLPADDFLNFLGYAHEPFDLEGDWRNHADLFAKFIEEMRSKAVESTETAESTSIQVEAPKTEAPKRGKVVPLRR